MSAAPNPVLWVKEKNGKHVEEGRKTWQVKLASAGTDLSFRSLQVGHKSPRPWKTGASNLPMMGELTNKIFYAVEYGHFL